MLTAVKIVNDLFFMNDFVLTASKSYKKSYEFNCVRSFVNFYPEKFRAIFNNTKLRNRIFLDKTTKSKSEKH